MNRGSGGIQDPGCLHFGQQPQLAVQRGDEAQHSAKACYERRLPLYQPSTVTCLICLYCFFLYPYTFSKVHW